MKADTMSRVLTGRWTWALVAAVPLALAGCSDRGSPAAAPAAPAAAANQDSPAPESAPVAKAEDSEAALKAERAKLSPEDQQLVAAQEWCAVSTTERLGGMGRPVKVMVKGQPVFLCCTGCQKNALGDPDKTLANVEELKAKVRADKDKK
jgi:hypothetical protein